MTQVRPAQCGANVRSALQRLWLHEHLRVYGDRLVDGGDAAWLRGALLDVMRARFDCRQEYAELFDPDKEVIFGKGWQPGDFDDWWRLLACSEGQGVLCLYVHAAAGVGAPFHAPALHFGRACQRNLRLLETLMTRWSRPVARPHRANAPQGDFLKPGAARDQRPYEELPSDPARLARLLETYQVKR
jgi:hypothetical protein